jgi:hypothetical protein
MAERPSSQASTKARRFHTILLELCRILAASFCTYLLVYYAKADGVESDLTCDKIPAEYKIDPQMEVFSGLEPIALIRSTHRLHTSILELRKDTHMF